MSKHISHGRASVYDRRSKVMEISREVESELHDFVSGKSVLDDGQSSR